MVAPVPASSGCVCTVDVTEVVIAQRCSPTIYGCMYVCKCGVRVFYVLFVRTVRVAIHVGKRTDYSLYFNSFEWIELQNLDFIENYILAQTQNEHCHMDILVPGTVTSIISQWH